MPTLAVLFDFDGVLADTENVHVAAWQRTLGLTGWDAPDELCAEAAEVDDRAFAARAFASRNIEGADLDGWVRRKQELARDMLGDAPRLYPGVLRLLGQLRGRARLAIVSTARRDQIDAVLGSSGLLEAFDLIVAKEDVAAPKPDPESYRLALARLDLPAADVVALEDSPTGIAAATGARVRVVAVGHRRPKGDWIGPSGFVTDLIDPAPVLAALGLDRGDDRRPSG